MDNTTVYFKYDTAKFSLHYPKALTDMTQASLKKLFKYMVSWYDREANAEAIRKTTASLQDLVVETKELWHKRSVEYQNGYVDTKFNATTAMAKKRLEANNKKLLTAVKSAKAKHERAVKLQTYFNEIKVQYEINE